MKPDKGGKKLAILSPIEFLDVWETLYNPDFNRVEFDAFRSQAGLNSFVMMPQKWVDAACDPFLFHISSIPCSSALAAFLFLSKACV